MLTSYKGRRVRQILHTVPYRGQKLSVTMTGKVSTGNCSFSRSRSRIYLISITNLGYYSKTSL